MVLSVTRRSKCGGGTFDFWIDDVTFYK